MTNFYPVDSATRPCCGGIGAQTRDCLRANAGRTYPWTDDGNGHPVRPFVDNEWTVSTADGDLSVSIEGVQTLTEITRELVIDGRVFTLDQARVLVRVIHAAVDLLEIGPVSAGSGPGMN